MRCLALALAFATCAQGSAFPEGTVSLRGKLLEAVRHELPPAATVRADIPTSLPSRLPSDLRVSVLSPHPPLGLVTFSVDWSEAGKTRHAYGNAHVVAEAKIAVAKHPVRYGERLSAANVALETRNLQIFAVNGYFTTLEDLSGREAAGFLRTGDVLGVGNTRAPRPVTAGQMLDLVEARGNLVIRAKVRALENGNLEDWIRVENPASRKQLQVRVAAAGEVRLH